MNGQQNETSQILDIDSRQNEVLQQLDQLNARLEALIKQCTRRDQIPAGTKTADHSK